MTWVTVLGSTGSIGASTLDVIRLWSDRFRVYALVAGSNAAKLAGQILEFRPRVAVVETEAARRNLIERLEACGLDRAEWPELAAGTEARVAAATAPEVGFLMSAIVGVAGLEATYAGVRAGKKVGLANKEALVASGALMMEAARASGSDVIPVDSEHNGAHQCLRAGRRSEVARLILTASGGPFRGMPREQLDSVTPEQALNHPTWRMGPRITIDSATMMNKGFEVIEACWLFGFSADEVDVVVHPQSSVHAMVEFNDGSLLAQMSATDMRMPIQYAMTWPDRLQAPVPRMDWSRGRSLEFFPPDLDKFPLLRLAYEAHRAGGSATCTLNAADEVAVEAFLQGRISFPGIAALVEETLARVPSREAATIAEVLETDRLSRRVASELAQAGGRSSSARGKVVAGTVETQRA